MNAFEAVKQAVLPEEYAAELTELRPQGLRLVGRCPVPDHDDRTPSFNIWTGSGSWWCFGACARGGDVIDLCRAVEGGEPWEAMMTLAMRYDIELPQRSPKWLAWQKEKLAIEDLAEDIRFRVRCRRTFKLLVLSAPEIRDIEDPAEKREEIRRCWEAFQEGMKRVPRWKRVSR